MFAAKFQVHTIILCKTDLCSLKSKYALFLLGGLGLVVLLKMFTQTNKPVSQQKYVIYKECSNISFKKSFPIKQKSNSLINLI